MARSLTPKFKQKGKGKVGWSKHIFTKRVALCLIVLYNNKMLNLPIENVVKMLTATGFKDIAEEISDILEPEFLLIKGFQALKADKWDPMTPWQTVGELFIMLQQKNVIDVRLENLAHQVIVDGFPGIGRAIRRKMKEYGNYAH